MKQTADEPHPPEQESITYIKSLKKDTVHQRLKLADEKGRLLFQPRCGVGDHDKMKNLLMQFEKDACPDILTITIDSHTRLKNLAQAFKILNTHPENLNGYPLCTHGWQRGRDLNEAIQAPLQIRHGSPDARHIFATTLASGITAFEGGGISYNIPYCKNVTLETSLNAWQEVDQKCGELAKQGIIIDRELFGTLSAVLVPPSISIAISILEMILAVSQGVQCISIAYPQSGSLIQDIAALKAIRVLSKRFTNQKFDCFPVMHEFMGVFPKDKALANGLIFYGGLVARMGQATKIITKTNVEAAGIPSLDENIQGLLTAKAAQSFFFDFIKIDSDQIEEEMSWIIREVEEILADILQQDNLTKSIIKAFEEGTLDIPFATSKYAHSKIIPMRDAAGSIRYYHPGKLGLSAKSISRNNKFLKKEAHDMRDNTQLIMNRVYAGINYFSLKCP